MKVIDKGGYLTNQHEGFQFNAKWMRVFIPILICIGLAFLFLSVYSTFSSLILSSQDGYQRILSMLSLFFAISFVYGAYITAKYTLQYQNSADNFAQGIDGEEKFVQFLENMIELDENWTIIKNYKIPSRIDDIDCILIGPTGIYAIEVKAYSGKHMYYENQWFAKGKTDFRQFKVKNHPGKQAFRNAKRLETLLKNKGLMISVLPRLVWAGPGSLVVRRGYTPVWFIDESEKVKKELENFETLSPDQINQIVEILR